MQWLAKQLLKRVHYSFSNLFRIPAFFPLVLSKSSLFAFPVFLNPIGLEEPSTSITMFFLSLHVSYPVIQRGPKQKSTSKIKIEEEKWKRPKSRNSSGFNLYIPNNSFFFSCFWKSSQRVFLRQIMTESVYSKYYWSARTTSSLAWVPSFIHHNRANRSNCRIFYHLFCLYSLMFFQNKKRINFAWIHAKQ